MDLWMLENLIESDRYRKCVLSWNDNDGFWKFKIIFLLYG